MINRPKPGPVFDDGEVVSVRSHSKSPVVSWKKLHQPSSNVQSTERLNQNRAKMTEDNSHSNQIDIPKFRWNCWSTIVEFSIIDSNCIV